MPREKISAKYTGQNGEHYMGLPARDIGEEEFGRLSDEHKALLAESSFYTLRHDAPAEAEKAPEPVVEAPFLMGDSGPETFIPEPKDKAQK